MQCQDCIIPNALTHEHFNKSFWDQFILLPGKDFRDIPYLSWSFQGKNYYYCVASVWEHDMMRGYPLATSNICAGKFCGERKVSKGEFFQTLSNLLIDNIKNNYSAPRKAIKAWLEKQNKKSYEYRVFTTEELDLINSKQKITEKITTRTEFTSYLKYCMFNPYECWFQTFEMIGKGVWPLSELNILVQAEIISSQDTKNLSLAITPKQALEKLNLLYDLHTKCEINSDYDCDGIPNHEDNCPYTYNPSQNDLDGYGIGDVCDDDIDGDGLKNPVGLVDDTWNINYWLLKNQKSEDPTPLGESKEESSYGIKVTALSNTLPTLARFEITGQENPAQVERDFGDSTTSKGTIVQHTYISSGIKTITAKVTLKWGQTFLLSQQISIWSHQDSAYALNIKILEINNQNKTAKFQAEIQGNFDSLERINTANWKLQKLNSLSPFTTSLEAWKRNNITLKGYDIQGELVAIASLDILDQNWIFFSFNPKYTPLLKTLDSKISTSLLLNNLSLNTIENIKWDFWDGTNFSDKKLANTHVYSEDGMKVLIQKIHLKNGQELIATSSLTITDPKALWNQAFNLILGEDKGNISLRIQSLENLNPASIWLKTFINGKLNFSTSNVSLHKPFLTLNQRQGSLKIKNKIQIAENTVLEHEGIAFLKNKNAWIDLNTDQLFSGLKCDLDKDGIPDLYDDDLDGDGVKNLLGMILYERDDCKLIIGENVDKRRYQQHFWVCSLDNCPFNANKDQIDINLNGVGDQCEEWKSSCWDGKIDPGENCKNCSKDVWPCTAFCSNWKVEVAEDCKNCPKDVPICPITCGNEKIDPGEDCDHGKKNGKDWKCSISCSLINPKKPNCGNGKIDPWEDCTNCPQDLKDICIDDGKISCGNGKIDPGENCTNCPQDVPNCDRDEDGCPDITDPCPNLPGINWCCPEVPTPCEWTNCPLVKPLCNQCPCHFADYSNTLQKNDQVRAKLRDQKLNVHYNYSPFVGINNFLKFDENF